MELIDILAKSIAFFLSVRTNKECLNRLRIVPQYIYCEIQSPIFLSINNV